MAINSLSASSYGLSGLVSGMDTQSMVEKMLTGTQSKIDATNQKKSVLEMKQQLYRDVAAQVKALQTNFLSFTSSTNLLSNAFYNNMKTAISTPNNVSAAFSVSASSSATTGTVSVDYIKQLATAYTKKTNVNASATVSGTLNQDVGKRLLAAYTGNADATMTIKVGTETLTIDDAPLKFAGMSQTEVAAELNKLFGDNSIGATARFANNKLEIIANDSEDFVVVQGNQSNASANPTLSMLMFGKGITNLSGKGTLSTSIDTDGYMPNFTVDLDGRSQTIHMDLKALQTYANTGNATDLVNSINDQLKHTFGTGVSATLDNGAITFKPGATSQKFTVSGSSTQMAMLGLKSGVSNKLNTTMALKDLNFGVDLQGSRHTFKVNGVEFSYDSSASLSDVINDINSSKAGVKITYVESEDRFKIESSETGAGVGKFEVSQTEGNLMSVLFGADGASTATGNGISVDMVGSPIVASEIARGGVYTFNVNGKDVSFTIPWEAGQGTYSLRTFGNKMNEAFADYFGYMADGAQAVEFRYNNADRTYTIHTNDESFDIKAVALDKDKNKSSLGFTVGQSTFANGNSTLDQAGVDFATTGGLKVTVGGTSFTIGGDVLTGNKTMAEVADIINQQIRTELGVQSEYPTVSFDATDGAFKLTGRPGEVFEVGPGNAVTQNSMTVNLNVEGTALTINLDDTDLNGLDNDGIAALLTSRIAAAMPGDPAAPTIIYNSTSKAFEVQDVPTTMTGTVNGGGGMDYEFNLGGFGNLTVQTTAAEMTEITDTGTGLVDQKKLADLLNQKIAAAMPGDATAPYVVFNQTTQTIEAYRDTATMSVSRVEVGDGENLEKLFGEKGLSVNKAVDLPSGVTEYSSVTQQGQNAIISINGNELERNSNTFTVDGLTYTLHSTTVTEKLPPVDDGFGNIIDDGYRYQDPSKITVTRDTEKIVEGINEFLKKYNETMDFLYGLMKSDATYKNYAPLTDAQKAEMSDREVELWEEKSKEGLLRNDSYVERLIQSMRSIMYSKPEGSSIALYDLGVTTSYYTNDGNLNPVSVDDLRAKIEENPDALRQLFAGEGGLMEQLNDAINSATSSSYGSPGYLTQVAGANGLDTSSSIYKQVKQLDEQLVTLENKYWAEYNRYWKQFNSMEQMIQNMNTQSSWLSQQFS